MADALSVLGQSNPTANVLTTLYTVPGLTSATTSSLIICNQSSSSAVFSISVAVNGAADSPKQYIYYGLYLDGNDTFIATIGLSLASGDQIRVLANTGNLSFNLFGVQIS